MMPHDLNPQPIEPEPTHKEEKCWQSIIYDYRHYYSKPMGPPSMSNACFIKPEVQRRINLYLNTGKQLTWEEWEGMFTNSYERAALYPIMDNNCLVKLSKKFQDNFSTHVLTPSTYEHTMLELILPLLTERLSQVSPDRIEQYDEHPLMGEPEPMRAEPDPFDDDFPPLKDPRDLDGI